MGRTVKGQSSEDYVVSSVIMKRNKFNRKWFSLNYRKRSAKFHIYPTLKLDSREVTTVRRARPSLNAGKIDSERGEKKKPGKKGVKNCSGKSKLRIVPHSLKNFELFFSKNKEKILKLAECTVDIYAINDKITICNYSKGGLIRLRSGIVNKMFFVTFQAFQEKSEIDKNDNCMFYCTFSQSPHLFLQFFDELTKIDYEQNRFDFFEIARKKFGLSVLGDNKKYSNFMRFYCKQENSNNSEIYEQILMFEVPEQLLPEIDYSEVPFIDLDQKKDKFSSYSKNNLFFISHHLEYQNNINDSKHNKIYEEYMIKNFNTQNINFGEQIKIEREGMENHNDIIRPFKCSSVYGGVGSLLHSVNSLKPVGINLGFTNSNVKSHAKDLSYNENKFLNLESSEVRNLLKAYLEYTSRVIIDFN